MGHLRSADFYTYMACYGACITGQQGPGQLLLVAPPSFSKALQKLEAHRSG